MLNELSVQYFYRKTCFADSAHKCSANLQPFPRDMPLHVSTLDTCLPALLKNERHKFPAWLWPPYIREYAIITYALTVLIKYSCRTELNFDFLGHYAFSRRAINPRACHSVMSLPCYRQLPHNCHEREDFGEFHLIYSESSNKRDNRRALSTKASILWLVKHEWRFYYRSTDLHLPSCLGSWFLLQFDWQAATPSWYFVTT